MNACAPIHPFLPLGLYMYLHSSLHPIPNQTTATMLPLLFFLLLLLTGGCTTTTIQYLPNYLKLPLHPALPFPTPDQPLSLVSAPIVSGAPLGTGQYLVHFSLGTPPQTLRLVADTGSDLIWTRCSPCRGPHCHHPASFLPRLSSSFSPFHCFSSSCRLVPRPPAARSCNRTILHSPCRYRYTYADRSSSAGFFSRETATFRLSTSAAVHLRGLRFGCGFTVSGGPSFDGAHGVMGLGRGPISFTSQIGRRFGNTFSYCLMDYTLSPPPTSYLQIGRGNNFTGRLSFTPLESNPLSPTFYYVSVSAASVNGIALRIHPWVWAVDPTTGNGGMVIDSGTTLSFFPSPAYKQVVNAMRRALPRAALVAGPAGFDLCINSTSTKRTRLPRLSLHLRGGAQLSPPPRNYFVAAAQGISCLALQAAGSSTNSGFGVIGNLMQQGFLFVFDRDRSRLGFSRRGCAAAAL